MLIIKSKIGKKDFYNQVSCRCDNRFMYKW